MREKIPVKSKYKYTCDYCGKVIAPDQLINKGSDIEYDFHKDCYEQIPKVLRNMIKTIHHPISVE